VDNFFSSDCNEGVHMRRKRECSGRRRKTSIWKRWGWCWWIGAISQISKSG